MVEASNNRTPALRRIQPRRLQPQAHGLGGVAGAEFAHHLHAVNLDGARTDLEVAGDGLVAAAFGEAVEDLALAHREAGDALARLCRAGA